MSFAYKISAYNRRRKWRLFWDTFSPTAKTKILDIGYSNKEYSKTDNYLEKHYPHKKQIMALGVEEPSEFVKRYPEVDVVTYDGQKFPLADKQFDICWSNAVIEHVGDFEAQLNFLKEIKRVSRNAFLTTPNKHFPVEVHTRTPLIHFAPKKVFEAYLKATGREWATGDYMWLLSLKDIKKLLEEAGISKYKIIKNKFSGFTIDFVIVFGEVIDKQK